MFFAFPITIHTNYFTKVNEKMKDLSRYTLSLYSYGSECTTMEGNMGVD